MYQGNTKLDPDRFHAQERPQKHRNCYKSVEPEASAALEHTALPLPAHRAPQAASVGQTPSTEKLQLDLKAEWC